MATSLDRPRADTAEAHRQTRDLARLDAHAAAADAAGWLLPAQQAVIHRRGWLRMLAPRAAGGCEWDLPRVVRFEEVLAATDGSCGWVVTLCAGAGWFAGFLPPELARAVIGTRRVCIAGSGAPTGFADREGDGWRLDGQWSHASGAPMATHFTLNAVLREGGVVLRDAAGQPRIRAFIVPAAGVSTEPGWFATGMRATGSNAYGLRGVRVPDDHGFTMAPETATAPGPLYRFPFMSLAWVTLAANVAGLARHFVAHATPIIRHRRPAGADVPLGELPSMQHRLAAASHGLASTWQALLAELDAAWAEVVEGHALPPERQQALEARARALVDAAREAVDRLYPCCGLHAADTRTALHRIWRDFHTASQHALLTPR